MKAALLAVFVVAGCWCHLFRRCRPRTRPPRRLVVRRFRHRVGEFFGDPEADDLVGSVARSRVRCTSGTVCGSRSWIGCQRSPGRWGRGERCGCSRDRWVGGWWWSMIAAASVTGSGTSGSPIPVNRSRGVLVVSVGEDGPARCPGVDPVDDVPGGAGVVVDGFAVTRRCPPWPVTRGRRRSACRRVVAGPHARCGRWRPRLVGDHPWW